MILGIEKPTPDTLIYVSGPKPMALTLIEDLVAAGIDRQNIVKDSFPNYTEI